MRLATLRRAQRPASEEAIAATRLVIGLTASAGGMAAAIGFVAAEPMAIVGLPTLALLAALALRSTVAAAWAGVGVWLVLLSQARAEGILAPLLMIGLCLAIALGPHRLLSWIVDQATGQREPPPVEGWIEEDGRPVD